MKKVIAMAVGLCMMGTAVAQAAGDISVLMNGTAMEFEQEPFIDDGTTLVPLRAIFEALGAEVNWYETTRTITSQKADTEISLTIDSDKMTVNGLAAELEKAPVIVDDFTYIPLRAVAEAFGCEVSWDGDTRTITITASEDKPKNAAEGYVSKLMSNLPDDVNYVVSPFSLKMAMMMLANGAENDTLSEILNAFDTEELDEYNDFAKEVIENLNSTENGKVNIANSIWFNKDGYENADFSEHFKTVIADVYDGTAEYVTDANSVEHVNEWVEEKTNGKIKNLIGEEQRGYLLALVNAIYMKAKWVQEFDPKLTGKGIFTDINGNESEIELMHNTGHYSYYEDEDTQILRMPYRNHMSMYVVLGDTSTFDADILNMQTREVHVTMPKFKIEYNVMLTGILKNMGITKAFEYNNTDFNSMVVNVPHPLKLETALQKAIIEVDEGGTEAAAATFLAAGTGASPIDDSVYFTADKPFTYYIIDDTYGEVLFAGRYVKAE